MLQPFRFVLAATRGSRLAPWKSPYIRWRIETYSGMWAEELTPRKIAGFAWINRWDLLRYLWWTDRVLSDARRARR